MAVTQRDIARHLNISRQQTGFALRGDGRVSEETRQRVLQAARELGYEPGANAEARTLIGKRYGRRALTQALGYLPFGEDAPYYMRMINAARKTAHRYGQQVLLMDEVPSLGWERVDGIISHDGLPRDAHGHLLMPMPFVGIFEEPGTFSTIGIDDRDGARQATQHLLDLGHRRIGYLVYTGEGSLVTQQRVEGYRGALRDAGVTPRPEWQRLLWDCGDFITRGRVNMTQWLNDGFRESGLTALLVQNDRAAIGAMQSMQAVGLRVPQDISVVGFDDADECEMASPRLTSIHVPFEELGSIAVEMLLGQINEEVDCPQTKCLPVRLEIRDSTAAPRTGKSKKDH